MLWERWDSLVDDGGSSNENVSSEAPYKKNSFL